MKKWVAEKGANADYQVIWQNGKYYSSDIAEYMKERELSNVKHFDFIRRMDLAYAVADVVISRAGAGTISELCVAGKATIFVPSPNVTEDHQTHNAMALVDKEAALMVRDDIAEEILMDTAEELLSDSARIRKLETNALKLGRKGAAEEIAAEVLSLIR